MTLQIPKTKELIDKILMDIYDFMIIFVANRGHGKSTSLKHIISELKKDNPDIIIKAFDISQSWFWCAPLEYRQLVTLEKIYRKEISNIGDCVYELGLLSEQDQRNFIASIVQADYLERYNFKLTYGEIALRTLPFIIYVLEESNIAFDSYSLKRNDKASEFIQKFVSVGRNFNLSAFLCCTRMKGELSTEIRERSGIIIGRINGASELRNISSLSSKEHRKLAKMIPKYYFTYSNADPVPFRIPDTVKRRPKNFIKKIEVIDPVKVEIPRPRPLIKRKRKVNWLSWGMGLSCTLWILYLIYASIFF